MKNSIFLRYDHHTFIYYFRENACKRNDGESAIFIYRGTGVVSTIGMIYGILLDAKLAKAEEQQVREKAKAALKNAIIGFVLIFVLMIALMIGLPAMVEWLNQKGEGAMAGEQNQAAGEQNQAAGADGNHQAQAQGGYNREAVAPFLGKAEPLFRYFGGFRGQAMNRDALSDEDKKYFYHATTLENLASILSTGLDPDRGGIGGAGTRINGEEDYQEPQEDTAQNLEQHGFNQRSHGYVHASELPEVVVPYAYEYDYMTDEGRGIDNIPVILRFKKDVLKPAHFLPAFMSSIWHFNLSPLRGYESDPDHRGAIRTKTKVDWDQIEILTEEGWTPFSKQLDNGNCARDEILHNVQEINLENPDAHLEEAIVEVEPEQEQEPELMSITDLQREDGRGQIGRTPMPGVRDNSRDKGMGK